MLAIADSKFSSTLCRSLDDSGKFLAVRESVRERLKGIGEKEAH